MDKVPHGHWKVTTVVAALRHDGVSAVMTVDGALNGDLFVAYVEQCLVPTLQGGDVVVLDNLSAHKREQARQAVERAGASVMFLPPYSPDFNPIEELFSKLKELLRRVAARTKEAVYDAVGEALKLVSAEDILGWFRHAGLCAT